MKKIKKLWKQYNLMLIIELLVIIVMLGSAGVTYKLTYEREYENAKKMFDEVREKSVYDEKSVSDFLLNLQRCSIYQSFRTSGGNKYKGYGVAWEICDENDNILEQSTDNDLMLMWKTDGDESTSISDEQVYLVENYFTEEEMDGAWEFISSLRQEEPSARIIKKVVGYYDENNEFIPVEIVFWDYTTKEYSLKSKENINKEGVVYITRNGDTGDHYGDVIADEEGEFSIRYLKKRKDSVNKFIKTAKKSMDHGTLHERGYYYEALYRSWSASANEDMISGEEQSEADSVRIMICADLNYMTLNNTIFKIYLIIEVILCLLIEIGIIYIIRKNEKRRRYLDSMKYTFINAMAHEMKTPSAVIVNSVECIEDGVKPEKQKGYMDKIKKEGLHMNRLLLDMLTYTKLTDEDRKINKEEMNMKELFEEVIKHYADAIEKKNIEVQWDIRSEGSIMADRNLMEMVADNYLSNAVKYCKQSGIIKITIDEKKVFVFNHGERIYPTQLQAIWEPLHVTDKARRNREGSSGMGLAISAKIMDLHGMKYGARNTVDGVEFYINFHTLEDSINTKKHIKKIVIIVLALGLIIIGMMFFWGKMFIGADTVIKKTKEIGYAIEAEMKGEIAGVIIDDSDVANFVEKAEENGYTVVEKTELNGFSDEDGFMTYYGFMEVYLATSENNEYQIELFLSQIKSGGAAAFTVYTEEFEEIRTGGTPETVAVGDYENYSVTDDTTFYYVARVGETAVCVKADKEYADEIKAFMDEIGY